MTDRELMIDCPRCGHCCPQRQWVGLTNQERNHIWRDFIGWGDPSHDEEKLMKAIEATLKEKNSDNKR